MITFEVIVWFVLIVILFIMFNYYFELRTAASIFLSVLIASFFCLCFYSSMFSEVAICFALVIGLIYAVSRAVQDKRDKPIIDKNTTIVEIKKP